MTDTPAPAPPPVPQEPPYAWVVVWACFGSLALIFGLCGLICFVLGVGGGMLADRFGPRAVCMTGMACIAAGLLGTSLAQSMATVYLRFA